MNLKKNKATLIETKIDAGMATKKDKEWLKKYKENLLKIKK